MDRCSSACIFCDGVLEEFPFDPPDAEKIAERRADEIDDLPDSEIES